MRASNNCFNADSRTSALIPAFTPATSHLAESSQTAGIRIGDTPADGPGFDWTHSRESSYNATLSNSHQST
jgi:hypothetical protein